MKTISKVKIHFFFYIFTFICIMSGLFKDYIMIMFIVSVHELGHILVALYYKWNIRKIVILPFGGITIFNELINRPIKEEFMIAAAGPIFQSILFIFIDNSKFIYYNKALLIFNLIPIIPLDGSKIVNLFFNKIVSFKRSNFLTNLLSILMILVLIILNKKNLMGLLIIFLLLVKILEEIKKYNFIFNRFLFERYLYSIKFSKNKIITSNKTEKMKKDYKHLFYIDNRYVTEKEILRKKFDK